jgi:hypothetical protein
MPFTQRKTSLKIVTTDSKKSARRSSSNQKENKQTFNQNIPEC